MLIFLFTLSLVFCKQIIAGEKFIGRISHIPLDYFIAMFLLTLEIWNKLFYSFYVETNFYFWWACTWFVCHYISICLDFIFSLF